MKPFKNINKSNKGLIVLFLAISCFFLNIEKTKGQAAIIALLVGDKVATEEFNLSMELGFNLARYSNVDNFERGKLGINFGIAGNWKFHKNWILSPSIYFLANRKFKVTKYSVDSGDNTLDGYYANRDADISINYIDVPIFLSYQTNNEKYRFGIAPQVSFLQKSSIIVNGDHGDFTENFNKNIEHIDYGIAGGITYVLGQAMQGKGIHVHLRYYYGLTNVFQDSFSPNDNRSSSLSLHFSLPFITEELANKNLEKFE